MQNIILVKTDSSCDMAAVYLNDKLVMEGNFWDFHPHCHGIHKYDDFKGVDGLVNAIIKTIGPCEIKREKYNFND